jgi:hypothetical protein
MWSSTLSDIPRIDLPYGPAKVYIDGRHVGDLNSWDLSVDYQRYEYGSIYGAHVRGAPRSRYSITLDVVGPVWQPPPPPKRKQSDLGLRKPK